MKKYFKILIIAVLFLSFKANLQAENIKSTFDSANNFYNEKNYAKALDSYKQILKTGNESANLYYNLGNCYYRLDSLNNALLYYEKALKLKPHDEDIEHNIAYINSFYTDKIENVPQLFLSEWHTSLIKLFPKSVWTIISIVFYILLFLSIVFIFISAQIRNKKIALIAAIVIGFFTAISSFYAFKEFKLQKTDNAAIVFTPTLNVKSSPDEQSSDLFVIHEGTKVFLLDNIGEWYKIMIKDGNQGWIKSEDFKAI